MEINTRKKLKLRIIEKYDTLTNFAKHIGYSKQSISSIITGERFGSIELWNKMGKELDLTPAEMWEYQTELRRLKKENGK